MAADEQFGPYLVYERLGVGGMATVHRALERGIEGFERMVALKRLLPHLAEDASFIKSFVREAKLASVLNHVNIVQIFELGRVAAEYFISMEYIDGRDIRRILRHARKVTGPPPVNITIGMLLQLCEALDYAHTKVDEEGQPLLLVHRDVSPSNVLVTTQGHLKVIDFGIAKAQSSQLRTQTGRVKGKLAYMAPEAVSGSKDLDARSDLWAVGVIAHELLTARPLFASKNEYQTLLKVQRGDIVPPSTFNQACPPELDAIVAKALERDPDDRFRGASEMRDALMQLRVKKGLQTGYRDIAAWVEWAFSIEAPSGSFPATTAFEKTGGVRTPTPRPAKRDDDEAVEIAWGGGEQSAEPLLLDDVPDVSEKHLGASPLIEGGAGSSAEARRGGLDAARDSQKVLDDIPGTAPSHGVRMPPSGRFNAALTPASPRSSTVAGPGVVKAATRPTGAFAFETEPKTNPTRTRDVDATDPNITAAPDDGVDLDEGARTLDGTKGLGIEIDVEATPRPAPLPMPRPSTVGRPSPTARRAQDTERNPTIAATLAAASAVATPVAARSGGLDGMRNGIPRTKPGMGAAVRARSVTSLPPEDASKPGADVDPAKLARAQRTSSPTLGHTRGAGELGHPPRRIGWILGVLVLAGGAAVGITMYVTRAKNVDVSPGPDPKLIQKQVGTLKFITEPADSEIRIEGLAPHAGSPWSIELEAGPHQIEIHHDGYKAWLSSVEVATSQTNTLTVALGPLGAKAAADAMLMLGASTPGLEALIDGKVLDVRTPIKMPIAPGAHAIALRKDGLEIWKTTITAKAASDYTFDPSFLDPKRQRAYAAPRTTPDPDKETPSSPAPPPPLEDRKALPDPAPRDKQPDPPPPIIPTPPPTRVFVNPEMPTPTVPPPTVPPRVGPTPAPDRPTPPIARPAPPVVGPALVAPSAVTKLSGDTPRLGVARNVDMPPVVSAKLCIDDDGKVTSAATITKLEMHAAEDLADVLRTWRYAPYKSRGTAMPACFVVSFRIK